jgi:hypothetical protein
MCFATQSAKRNARDARSTKTNLTTLSIMNKKRISQEQRITRLEKIVAQVYLLSQMNAKKLKEITDEDTTTTEGQED